MNDGLTLRNMRALGNRLVEAEKAMVQSFHEGPDPLLDYFHKYEIDFAEDIGTEL